jgi:hypothetical protein
MRDGAHERETEERGEEGGVIKIYGISWSFSVLGTRNAERNYLSHQKNALHLNHVKTN